MLPTSHHIISELSKCSAIEYFDNEDKLYFLLQEVVKEANLNALKIMVHKFEPIGSSGIAFLSESHLSFHLFTECQYVSVDCFTCGEDGLLKANTAIKYFAKALKCGFSHTKIFQRGIPMNANNTLFQSKELFVKND